MTAPSPQDIRATLARNLSLVETLKALNYTLETTGRAWHFDVVAASGVTTFTGTSSAIWTWLRGLDGATSRERIDAARARFKIG